MVAATGISKTRRRVTVALAAAFAALTAPAVLAGEAKKADDSHAAPDFVQLDWLMVQAREPNGRRRNLALLLTLEVDGDGANVIVASALPKLRDAFLRAFADPPLVRETGERVDPEEVKARALAASKAVLGADVVRAVLVRNINDTGAG